MGILSYAVLNFINNIFTKDLSKKKKVSVVIYIFAVIFIC
jgi:AGZA family xanthine/uracil permease-like MFS transporter